MARQGEAAWAIGLLSLDLFGVDELASIVIEAARGGLAEAHASDRQFVSAALQVLPVPAREALFKAVHEELPLAETVAFLALAPFEPPTWSWIVAAGDDLRAAYWKGVPPQFLRDSAEEASTAIEQLLEANRPLAAFASVHLFIGELDPELLFRLLSAITRTDEDIATYRIDGYNLGKAFERLNTSTAINLQDKAFLEFAWLEGLARGLDEDKDSNIPNLERLIESDPALFIQAITWAYKREDRGQDPEEYGVAEDRVSDMATKGYTLLKALRRIPGHNERGELEAARLAKWVTSVRKACGDLSRLAVADITIGELLARAPADPDGLWPCRAVRDVVEDIHSEEITRGMATGVFNSRGVTWRGPNGDQERTLADKYRRWGLAVQVSHPFLGAKLLFAMARSYEQDAEREDLEAGIRRRLH